MSNSSTIVALAGNVSSIYAVKKGHAQNFD
jgi:hypothetical protein